MFFAGTYEPKLEKEISQEQIRKTMEVNFFGVVNCIKAVEKYFKNKKMDISQLFHLLQDIVVFQTQVVMDLQKQLYLI